MDSDGMGQAETGADDRETASDGGAAVPLQQPPTSEDSARASGQLPASEQSWDRALRASSEELRRAHRFRKRRVIVPVDATRVEIDGRLCVNFAANDYLGLSHHPHVLAAMRSATERQAGSGAAGLITGYGPDHAAAEEAIARWKGAAAAVLLPSGYQANLAVIQALAAVGSVTIADCGLRIADCPDTSPRTPSRSAEPSYSPPDPQFFPTNPQSAIRNPQSSPNPQSPRFLLDKLVHASLLDAVRATGKPFRVFPHNHLGKLARLLADAPAGQLQVVVTESIFSMDGDAADLAGIADLKARHGFMLLVDEAHGSGVYGPNGAGYAAELALQHAVDVSIVTLSKALGCAGGAVCGSMAVRDAVLNHGRAYLFSTSLPPALAAAARAAIDVLHREQQRQQRLRQLARAVRQRLAVAGFQLPPGDSPIIPIVLGEESAALDAAAKLESKGLLAVAIRPPTVPPGSSRLRITLSCEHTDEQVDRLVAAIAALPRT